MLLCEKNVAGKRETDCKYCVKDLLIESSTNKRDNHLSYQFGENTISAYA